MGYSLESVGSHGIHILYLVRNMTPHVDPSWSNLLVNSCTGACSASVGGEGVSPSARRSAALPRAPSSGVSREPPHRLSQQHQR